jgi:hypothetical protein
MASQDYFFIYMVKSFLMNLFTLLPFILKKVNSIYRVVVSMLMFLSYGHIFIVTHDIVNLVTTACSVVSTKYFFYYKLKTYFWYLCNYFIIFICPSFY